MADLFTFALTLFMGLIAMMNPIANIPLFLSLMGRFPKEKQRALARKTVIVAFTILLGFILLGKFIFMVFGLTLPAFKITGGIIIFKIGFDMLQSKVLATSSTNAAPPMDDSVAICPLAIPILAGPGSIVTIMDFASHQGIVHLLVVIFIVALVLFINFLSFRSADIIIDKLGQNIINVLDKLMGLILAIMGTGMVIAGIEMLIK